MNNKDKIWEQLLDEQLDELLANCKCNICKDIPDEDIAEFIEMWARDKYIWSIIDNIMNDTMNTDTEIN